MTHNEIEHIVIGVFKEFCQNNDLLCEINSQTPLLGSNKVLDSIGLVNLIVDIETTFLDKNIEISLTSEAAMSLKISPFRSLGSISYFISKQLGIIDNE